MEENIDLMQKIKTLESHFGKIVATVKHLKTSVDSFQEQIEVRNHSKEVQEIMDTQNVIEEVIVANSDAINKIKQQMELVGKNDGSLKGQEVDEGIREVIERQENIDQNILKNNTVIDKLDKEIKEIMKDKSDKIVSKKRVDEAIERLDREILQIKKVYDKVDSAEELIVDSDDRNDAKTQKFTRKKCRYNNRGFCKFKDRCRYIHQDKICSMYLEKQTCDKKECSDRHPKRCKWLETREGCNHNKCDYLHTVKIEKYTCASCKHAWENQNHVVEHNIENMKIFFCLNCEDWEQNKTNVLREGWTLFDEEGFLRRDI